MRLVEVIETFNFFWLLSSIEPYFHLPSFLRKPIFIREHFHFFSHAAENASECFGSVSSFFKVSKHFRISDWPLRVSRSRLYICFLRSCWFFLPFFLSLQDPPTFGFLHQPAAIFLFCKGWNKLSNVMREKTGFISVPEQALSKVL